MSVFKENLTLAASLVAAIFTAWAVHYYSGQLSEMQKQTVIQRNVSMTSERAWLAVQSGATHFDEVPTQKGVATVTVDIDVKNTGQTPARQILAEAVVEIVRNGQDTGIDYGRYPFNAQVNNVLLAGASNQFKGVLQQFNNGRVETTVLSPTDLQQLKDGKDFLITFGRATYMDSFGRWHWQHFCSWATISSGTFTAQRCTAYNDMDRIDLDDDGKTAGQPPKDAYLSSDGLIYNQGPTPIQFSPKRTGD